MKKTFILLLLLVFCCSIYGQNYDIERYLNIRSASSPTFSPDGKRVAFLTNITGTSQIWMIDAGGGYPEQVTAYQDNVGFVEWSPNGSGLIFGKASGGDENTQLFLMSSNGADIKQLTNNPKVRYNFGSWSDDGAKIYYSSNKRDKNFFDVYAMNIADGVEELLYQSDGNNDFAAASKNGDKIIISRSGTELSLDNNLYLIDAKTKKETLLTAHTDASQFADAEFTSPNEIAFTTNDKREFAVPCMMNLANKEVFGCLETKSDTESIAVSVKGYAWTLNKDGFSELYVEEQVQVTDRMIHREFLPQPEVVKLPAQGIISGLTFSDDGKTLAFAFNSSKNNSDVWLYDLSSKKLTQLTKSSRSGIPQSSFVEPQLIKYKSFDGREISAWFYIPQSANLIIQIGGRRNYRGIVTPKNLPVIVSVHGGPEGQERPGFNPLYQYYLSRGYAILATNVRGSTGYGKTFTHLDDVYKREDSIKDLAAAAEWLKTSGGADAKRIAIMGGSYGGYATLAAITLYPDLWAAAVDTVGIANWESFFKNTSGYRKRQREVEYGMADKDADFLRSISPINKVGNIKTPLFVIAGKNDPRVPYTEAEQIVKALKDRNATVQYKLYDDEGHGIAKLKNRLELYPLVADFLDKYMK